MTKLSYFRACVVWLVSFATISVAAEPPASVRALAELLGKTPRAGLGTVVLENPHRVAQEIMPLSEDASDLDSRARDEFGMLRRMMRASLGADITDAEDMESELGVDWTKPISLSILVQDKLSGSHEYVLTATVTDAETFADAFRRFARNMNLKCGEEQHDGVDYLEATDEVAPLGAAAAVQKTQGYLFVSVSTRRRRDPEEVRKPAQQLKDYLQTQPKNALASKKAWRQTQDHIQGAGDLALFLNLAGITNSFPADAMAPLMDDLWGAGVVVGDSSAHGCLSFRENAKLLKRVAVGDPCDDFLAKFDKPALVLCGSSAEPLEFFREFALAAQWVRSDKSFSDEVLKQDFGLSYDEMSRLLKNGAAGFLLYGADKYYELPYHAIGFCRAPDEKLARKLIEHFMKRYLRKWTRRSYDGNLLYSGETYSGVTAIAWVDGYLVFGDAVLQIQKLAQGEGDGWAPSCGKQGQWISGELSVEEWLDICQKRYEKWLPPRARETAEACFGKSGQWVWEANFEGSVLKASVAAQGTTFGSAGSRAAALMAWTRVLASWESALWRTKTSAQGTILLDGKPLAGYKIRATLVGHETIFERASTDAQGKFTLRYVFPGDYALEIISDRQGAPPKLANQAVLLMSIDKQDKAKNVFNFELFSD